MNSKRQKPPIQRPSVRMQLQNPFTVQHLTGKHVKYMSELEEQALEAENRSQQDFLSTHLAVLCHAPPSLKRRSTFFLQYLTRELIIITSIHSICQGAPGTGVTTCGYFSQVRIHMVSPVKKVSSLSRCPGGQVH